jgi:hypothetical protein
MTDADVRFFRENPAFLPILRVRICHHLSAFVSICHHLSRFAPFLTREQGRRQALGHGGLQMHAKVKMSQTSGQSRKLSKNIAGQAEARPTYWLYAN